MAHLPAPPGSIDFEEYNTTTTIIKIVERVISQTLKNINKLMIYSVFSFGSKVEASLFVDILF